MTEVDICNLALNYIGEQGNLITIDPDEGGSYESELCKRLYPICRDHVLEEYAWGFALKRKYLALVATEVYGWEYQYVYPADAMRIIAVLYEGDKFATEQQEYKIEIGDSGVRTILTDVENAVCMYTYLNENSSLYPEYFCTAISYLLATRLSGSIIKGSTSLAVEQKLLAYYEKALGRAKELDAQQNRQDVTTTATWMEGSYYGD